MYNNPGRAIKFKYVKLLLLSSAYAASNEHRDTSKSIMVNGIPLQNIITEPPLSDVGFIFSDAIYWFPCPTNLISIFLG